MQPGGGVAWLRRLYKMYCIGGWDVVIFFDFLSVPQRTVAEDGSVIERTDEEEAVFQECLPSMGTLYSINQVLILPEVPDGDTLHEYVSSGWCTCELMIGMLGRTLHKYSEDEAGRIGRRSQLDLSTQNLDETVAARFERQSLEEIASKHFLYESDRVVALGIIQSFLSKRMLADAIRRKDMPSVRKHLVNLSNKGLVATLDEPVDDRNNTLLHVAVEVGCEESVQELLAFGATPDLRNLRGDTPSQWFLFPRCRRAATVLRARTSSVVPLTAVLPASY